MSDYTEYTVSIGESIKSIAFEAGHFWKTLWDDPKNAELKQQRKNPDILRAGDIVAIPPLRKKEETRPAEARHRFKRKATPIKITLVFQRNDQPVKNTSYTAIIHGKSQTGTTDATGKITLSIPPNAHECEVRLGDGAAVTVYKIHIGGLDPIDTITGLQHRLNALGYSTDEDSPDTQGPATTLALQRFQKDQDLSPTGKLDDATRDKLKQAFGC